MPNLYCLYVQFGAFPDFEERLLQAKEYRLHNDRNVCHCEPPFLFFGGEAISLYSSAGNCFTQKNVAVAMTAIGGNGEG